MLSKIFLYIIEKSQDFTTALSQHLYLTFVSLGISVFLGILLGVIATRIKWLRNILMFLGNIGRTIPSLAVLALALPLLGIGAAPSILALILIGVLPILVNTTIGIEQVDPNIKEAARGMGMNDFQILFKVEFPIAVSIIMAGIRTSAVLVVASATLAAFIGGGGLGDMILRGHALGKDHIVLAGAVPATLLAFYFEETFGRLEKWATPIGLKIGSVQYESNPTTLVELLSAIVVLPLVFGVFLPWEIFFDANGKEMIITGLHPEFQLFTIPVLLIGLVTALGFKPKADVDKRDWNSILKLVFSILLFVVMLFITLRTLLNLPASYQIHSGIFLTLSATFLLVLLSVIQMIRQKNKTRR